MNDSTRRSGNLSIPKIRIKNDCYDTPGVVDQLSALERAMLSYGALHVVCLDQVQKHEAVGLADIVAVRWGDADIEQMLTALLGQSVAKLSKSQSKPLYYRELAYRLRTVFGRFYIAERNYLDDNWTKSAALAFIVGSYAMCRIIVSPAYRDIVSRYQRKIDYKESSPAIRSFIIRGLTALAGARETLTKPVTRSVIQFRLREQSTMSHPAS